MWQKYLKQLKYQLPDPKEPVQPPAPNIHISEEDVDFGKYCKQQQIVPLAQNILERSHSPKKPKPNRDSNYASINYSGDGYEFFDETVAKTEFFCYGQKNLPKALRSGKLKIQLRLDLHNYTRTKAINWLDTCITNHPQTTTIAIIHGQGLNSVNNLAVLQAAIRKYLEHHPRLIAFTQGSPAQGGAGITLVKLKIGP